MDAIFLDTNCLRNEGGNRFFGNVEQYRQIAELTKIIIPSIVIEEIKEQKRRFLEKEAKRYQGNFFSKHYKVTKKEGSLKNLIERKIKSLYERSPSEINFIEQALVENGCLENIKMLAIKNVPPFAEDSDKGFKDAIIHLTVLQYLENNSENVFLITRDINLKKSFEVHDRVICLAEPDEYFAYRKSYFYEKYFIGRLRDHFGSRQIKRDAIKNVVLTADGDWEMAIEVNSEEQKLLIDFASKEIVSD